MPTNYGCTGDSLSNNAPEGTRLTTPSLRPGDRLTLRYAPAPIHNTGQVLQPLSEPKLETDRHNEPQPDLEHTPDSVLGRAAEREADRDANPNPSSQSQRLRLNVIFSVNISPKENRRWHPKKTVAEMSLRDLVEELSLQRGFSGLIIILETPEHNFEDSVTLNDEERFMLMKTRFQQKIAAILRTYRSSVNAHPLIFEICIRPIWDGGEGDDDDDDEIIF